MIKGKLAFLLALAIFLLPGCGNDRPGISRYRMINTAIGIGPWQIVTYEGDKVYHETIALEGGGVVVQSRSVYVSSKSQFIYKDGTPITTYDGKYLYWNDEGWVINRNIEIVSEEQVFIVNGKPMPPQTAMRLRDYHKPAPMVTLADIGKAG